MFSQVLTEYVLISVTSAVTVTIAGVVKEAVTILVSIIFLMILPFVDIVFVDIVIQCPSLPLIIQSSISILPSSTSVV